MDPAKNKIALLLYGQPRGIENPAVFESHRKFFISKYDTDVYAHMWWSPGEIYEASQWDVRAKPPPIKSVPNAIEIIHERYKPKKVIVEKQLDFWLSDRAEEAIRTYITNFGFRDDFSFPNILSQLYSINKVGTLIEDKDKYDWIILLRYDIVIDSFESSLESLDKNVFYCREKQVHFPDLVYVFNPKFLPALDTFNNFEEHMLRITKNPPFRDREAWEPSPECFKYCNFRKHFPTAALGGIRFTEHRIDKDARVAVGIT